MQKQKITTIFVFSEEAELFWRSHKLRLLQNGSNSSGGALGRNPAKHHV